MLNVKSGGYTRIDKRTARKMFNDGKTIRLEPCKIRPDNMHGFGADVDNTNYNFDDVAFWFKYYNCNNYSGSYVAYYVKEK